MLPLTYIEWDDAHAPCADGPWIAHADERLDISEPLVITSVGFVVRENEHYVQLAASVGSAEAREGDFEGSTMSGIITIPQRQISKRLELDVQGLVAKTPRVEFKRIAPKTRKASPKRA